MRPSVHAFRRSEDRDPVGCPADLRLGFSFAPALSCHLALPVLEFQGFRAP